jgi:hypothetical protein
MPTFPGNAALSPGGNAKALTACTALIAECE